jgi:divalent metal cation (Fe/Co/Zn/Cd) transporter
LIGEAASAEDERAIRAVASEVDGIGEIVEMRTLQVGPQFLIVGLEVRVTGRLDALDVLEERIRAAVPIAKYVAIEPATD